MKKFLTLVAVLSTFWAAQQVQAAQVSSQPAAVQPPLSAELRPEKSAFLLGEPISLEFVVHNSGAKDWVVADGGDYRNRLGRPESFKVEVRDEKGALVFQPKTGFGFGGLMGGQTIPAHGDHTFSLFLPHWATFSKSGRYRITVKRSLVCLLPGQTVVDIFNKPKSYVSVPASASADVEALPPDDKEFGALINRLGNSVLTRNGGQLDEDRLKLHSIHDARVVRFLIAEAEQFGFGDSALYALSQYNNEAAFGELKKVATESRPIDTRVYEAGFLPSDPNQPRLSAVRYIAWGKNARRTEFLLSLRHDPMADIRLIVVRSLGGLPVQRARAVWREMLGDSNAEVRKEAKRYLEKPSTGAHPPKSFEGSRAMV